MLGAGMSSFLGRFGDNTGLDEADTAATNTNSGRGIMASAGESPYGELEDGAYYSSPDGKTHGRSPSNKKFGEAAKKYGAAFGEMGNAIPSSTAYDSKYKFEGMGKQEKGNNAMNATKDAVANAVPAAKLFRGIEKAGVGIATATHGEEGGTVSQAMFSPSSSVMNVQESNMSGGDKALATTAAFLAPGLAGQMIHADRLKTRQAEYAKRFKKQTLLERKESEQEYKMSEGLASMENLKQLRKKQLGLS